MLFAAPKVAQVISELLSDNWVHAKPSDTRWGVKVNALISGVYGSEIPVVVKKDWGAWGTGTLRYGSNAYLIDMENVQWVPLRNTQYLPNRQANDADEQAAEFLTESSFRLQKEETHAKLYSVTT